MKAIAESSHASLTIGTDTWELVVYGVRRIGRDIFIQLMVLGPRTCTLTVRAGVGFVPGVTGQQILDLVCSWLLSGDPKDQAYLELPDACPQVH